MWKMLPLTASARKETRTLSRCYFFTDTREACLSPRRREANHEPLQRSIITTQLAGTNINSFSHSACRPRPRRQQNPESPPKAPGILLILAPTTYGILARKVTARRRSTAAVQAAIERLRQGRGRDGSCPRACLLRDREMKSNITLHIAARQAAETPTASNTTQPIPSSLSGDATLHDGNVGMIFAANTENASKGAEPLTARARNLGARRGVSPPSGRGGSHRPYHLLFYRCKNLLSRDIFLQASAYHSVPTGIYAKAGSYGARASAFTIASMAKRYRRVSLHQFRTRPHQQLQPAAATGAPARCLAVARM